MKILLMFLIFFLTILPTFGVAQPSSTNKVLQSAERRLALVIGNQNYVQSTGMLENPHNDADDMASLLDSLGFTVAKYKDLNREDFDRAIDDFGRQLKEYDVGLVYYSGHGIQSDGENFLIPTNAAMRTVSETKYQCVRLSMIFDLMEAAKLKTSIVLLDACRENLFYRGTRNLAGSGLTVPYNPPGSFVGYATRVNSTADDNAGQRNGLFTFELLKHLRVPNLGLRTIFDRTTKAVRERSGGRQIPGRYDELEGDFVFVQSSINQPNSVLPKIKRDNALASKSKPLRPESINLSSTKASGLSKQYLDLPFADMVYIPGGTFRMGDDEGENFEKPSHDVTLNPFIIGKYEITQGQWEYIMGDNPSFEKHPTAFSKEICLTCPVEQVSWTDVQEFIKKLNTLTNGNYRLPTEAEWEYAAGGGQGNRTRYGNGQNVLTQKQANYDQLANQRSDDYFMRHMRVGSFLPNSLGLHDMAGNVSEWCNDWFGDYPDSKQVNPKGSAKGSYRIFRGGNFSFPPKYCLIAHRAFDGPGHTSTTLGFRIAASVP